MITGCETTQVIKTVDYATANKSIKNIEKPIKAKNRSPVKKTQSPSIIEEEILTSGIEEEILTSGIEEEILKVGIMLPLTGKHYQIGKSLLNASQLALNKTQNKNIKFYVRDVGSENNLTRSFYDLLNEKVNIILGPIFTENIMKIRPLMKNENIQIITFSNNSLVAQNNLYVFGLTLEDEVESILSYALKKGHKKFAAILPNNEYGKSIKNEIIKFHSKNPSELIRSIMYETDSPDFYEIAKNISNYEQRKINLNLKIKELENQNTDKSIKELRRIKKLDTYGDLEFDSLFIGVENFQQLSMISSILPYYDVDPKRIQYLGNSIWNKNAVIKEPGLNNSLFTSYNRESALDFEEEYIEYFNQDPHPIASLAYDAVGLIVNLHNKKIPTTPQILTNKQGFIGINGHFKFNTDGSIDRTPAIYQVKNERLYKIVN